MKNNNKFANLLQSNNVNSSSRQVKSLTSITATKPHTAHSMLTYDNSNNTTIETQLALQTNASTDITLKTHPNYIDNSLTFRQRDDDSNYGDGV